MTATMTPAPVNRPRLVTRRRALLGGAAALAIPPVRATALPLVRSPFNRLVKGSPIKVRGLDLYGQNGPSWGSFWSKWDWFGYIKPMLDAAAAKGATHVKIACSGVSPDTSGNYPSDAVLQAQITQFCLYCASLGMGVYFRFGWQLSQLTTNGVSAAGTTCAKLAGWLNPLLNVIGIDVSDEVDLGQPDPATLISIATAIRGATKIPLTWSLNDPSPNKCALYAKFGGPNGQPVDFLDIHWYYYNQPHCQPPPSYGTTANCNQAFDITLNNTLASIKALGNYPGCFLLGETGAPMEQGQAPQTAWTVAVNKFVAANTDCLGAMWWTLEDNYGGGTYDTGMYTQYLGTEKTWITTPFAQWPGHL